MWEMAISHSLNHYKQEKQMETEPWDGTVMEPCFSGGFYNF